MSDQQPPPQPGPYGQQPPHQPPVPPGPQGQQPPQPGPFGAPPPQPPPSAQPPAPPQVPAPGGQPGAPGYGHPQQPPPGPAAPYGQPQQPAAPYGQPQQPGPYGAPPQPPGPYGGPPGAPYGGPVPPPPPPGGGGTGKVIGIIVAVVLVLGLAGGGIYALTQGDDNDDGGNQQADNSGGQGGGDDGKRYRLTFPETLLGGQYEKAEGEELDTADPEVSQVLSTMGISNAAGLNGMYFAGPPGLPQYSDSPENKALLLLGAYGDVADPQTTVEGAFTYMSEEAMPQTAEKVGEPETVQLDGDSGASMKCQITESENSGGELYQRGWCVWADQSTVAMGQYSDTTSPDRTVEMDTLTKLVSDVRNEVRVER